MTFKNLTIQTIPQTKVPDIHIETGELANQADGAVLVKSGKAALLVTVVEKKEKENLGFLPLSVDYQEKFYAAGKIPGGFFKREGKFKDQEILIARLVDRALRPCFSKNYTNAVQVTLWLLSADENVAADTLATLGASAALSISPIPFQGPVSAVRVARIENKLCINPPISDLEKADLDIMLSARINNIVMIEGKMKEVDQQSVLDAMQYGHQIIQQHCKYQQELMTKLGIEKSIVDQVEGDDQLEEHFTKLFYRPCYQVAKQGIKSKKERNQAFDKVKEDCRASLVEDEEINLDVIDKHFFNIKKKAIADLLINEDLRMDGRSPEDIRSLSMCVDYLPAVHGSALFTRGETQALTTITLGSKLDEQLIDSATLSGYQKVMLHYNFPGFSTGEVKPARGPSRREVGHANLALNGILPVLPDPYPYTIRAVSEILSSNGSTSMAALTSFSLAAADAGIPIKRHVAGIAMGRASSQGKTIILSDISGDEDFIGEMDFKLTGTQEGFTACQADFKALDITMKDVAQTLSQAKQGIARLLKKMNETMPTPRAARKPHAPSISTLRIESTTIGALIGPGGRIIKELQQETGTTIDITEKNDHGLVTVFAPNDNIAQVATQRIKTITAVPTLGNTYVGKIKALKKFGAFVEFMPNKDGLLHISEISHERIQAIEDVFKVGQEVQVKLINIDAESGKFGLSCKDLEND